MGLLPLFIGETQINILRGLSLEMTTHPTLSSGTSKLAWLTPNLAVAPLPIWTWFHSQPRYGCIPKLWVHFQAGHSFIPSLAVAAQQALPRLPKSSSPQTSSPAWLWEVLTQPNPWRIQPSHELIHKPPRSAFPALPAVSQL